MSLGFCIQDRPETPKTSLRVRVMNSVSELKMPLSELLQVFWSLLMKAGSKRASQVVLVVKNPSANTGDIGSSGSILGLARSPGEANDYPLQYTCLVDPMDRGDW